MYCEYDRTIEIPICIYKSARSCPCYLFINLYFNIIYFII